MTEIAVEIFMKETVGTIMENIMNMKEIMAIIVNR